MAKDGLLALLCLAALVPALPRATADPGENRDQAVANTLAVQSAYQQGKELLLRGETEAAVRVLEKELPRINGSVPYLTLLRDAYRAHVTHLLVSCQEATARTYLDRLTILDPQAARLLEKQKQALAAAVKSGSPAGKLAAPPPASKPELKVNAPRQPSPAAKAVAERPTDDPFRQAPSEKQILARTLLGRAEQEFGKRHFREACVLFDQAHDLAPGSTYDSQDRWAYSKLFRVVEDMKLPGLDSGAWAEFEKETRAAIALAPRMEFGANLLADIQKRRGPATVARGKAPESTGIKHIARGKEDWARAETACFRVMHNQPPELAEQVACVAEKCRVDFCQKWLGKVQPNWDPRCDIYLYATVKDYSSATGSSADAFQPWGHSEMKVDGSRFLYRRLDLPCANPRKMLTVVVPHETAHIVLGAHFGVKKLPRWADEGMAVLSEPRFRFNLHIRNLQTSRAENRLFTVRQLMQSSDYPDKSAITAFYAQSVSLVDFLARQRGPQEFIHFLESGLKNGWEPALKQHYGYRSFEELQEKWSQQAFAQAEKEPAKSPGASGQ